MTLSDYQKLIKATALYPNVGNNIIYPSLGLCGECGELFEKILMTPYQVIEILKELGDIMWYCGRLSSEINCNLTELYNKSLDFILHNNLKFEEEMIIRAGNISEISKKVLRDKNGIIDEKDKDKYYQNLIVVLYCVDGLCEEYGSTIEEIAQMNIEKLLDRKNRGVLKGSGDDR